MKLSPFPLSQVRLLDGRFKVEQERDRAYLLSLDVDRFLYTYRTQASLPTPGQPYGGWEAPTCELRGHSAGHYLSACALMFASAGDTELKSKADTMVAEMAKCQKALGGEYLSAFPESFWDRVETGQQVWAPYYTIHKIMAGLYDMYTLTGNAQALDVLKGMASYFKKRLDRLPADAVDKMLRAEFGGMSEVLHNLYSVTQDEKHLALAHQFDHPEFLGPLALSHDNLTRVHGNTQIPKAIGAARHYELTGDDRYRAIALFFWDRVVRTRSFATGGSTMFEHWPEPNKLSQTLGHLNHETCKTHNMLKLTRHLLCWTGEAALGDYYERALWNGILGTQGPQPGQLEYYVPMASGFPRVFGTPDASFWCCYGTGMESFAKLGDSVYFHDDQDLYVNLFVPSRLDWQEKGIVLEQTTAFPEDAKTTLKVELKEPTQIGIHIRVPGWIVGQVEVKVNGKPFPAPSSKPGSWLPLSGMWQSGDLIEISLPMALHSLGLPDDPQQVAVLYGPVVLAGIVDPRPGQPVCVDDYHESTAGFEQSTRPVYFLGDPKSPAKWVSPADVAKLTFKTTGQPHEVTLVPFYNIVAERYALYWPVAAKDSARHKALAERMDRWEREVDRVFVFPHQTPIIASEVNHMASGDKTYLGMLAGTAYSFRHAEPDGWFGWDLKVLPNQPMELLCSYWGSDSGREFDILVDDKLVATEKLNESAPERKMDVLHKIPAELTRGKQKVTVKFKANHGTLAGGVLGCATLKGK